MTPSTFQSSRSRFESIAGGALLLIAAPLMALAIAQMALSPLGAQRHASRSAVSPIAAAPVAPVAPMAASPRLASR